MSGEERPPIDHQAIRAMGETMAQKIGLLAAQEVDREPTIAFLNECADEVPYSTMFDEDTRLADAIGVIDSERKAIDEELAAEVQRLDGLVETFAAKRSPQLASARNLASQKKVEAKQSAEQRKAPLDTPLTELRQERQILTDTIESVSTAWPVPPYSEEALEAARALDYGEKIDGYDDDDGEPFADPTQHDVPRRVEQVKEKVLGPYAELADAIPSLNERLMRPVSKHIHVYGDVETAHEALDKATAKPQAERNEEEDLLVKAVFVLRRRYLMDPNDLSFLKVYEASDVIELTQRLNKFRRKNRPDFDELEGRILDKAAARIPLLGKDVPQDIKGAQERMTEDRPGRTGMTWHSLTKHANRACDTIRARLMAGGVNNEHLKKYVIEVADRSGTKPDISWIYQYIADEFAFDVLASRTTESQATAKERFIKNCEIISEWLEESQDLLAKLPENFRLKRHHKTRHNFRFKQRRVAEYEHVTARTSVMGVIRDIETRRNGHGDSKALRHKPMEFDPQGALNHQLRLGHMIDFLKEELSVYDAPTEGYTEEITPFE